MTESSLCVDAGDGPCTVSLTRTRGRCGRHYDRWIARRTPQARCAYAAAGRCSKTNTKLSRGLCRNHYEKARRDGVLPPPTVFTCDVCGTAMPKKSGGIHRFCSKTCTLIVRRAKNVGIADLRKAHEIFSGDVACSICGAREDIVGDHDHETGEFRGLLCGRCNVGIGMLGDSPERLRQAAEYLITCDKAMHGHNPKG
jgi:hypothetical protein